MVYMYFKQMYLLKIHLKHAVEPDRLVMDAVIILRLVEEKELMDAFVIHVFANDTF